MNDLLSILGGGQVGGTTILLQALGAAMRGESPQAFLRRLANNHPQLKKINFNDLPGEADRLLKENGMSVDEVTKQIDETLAPHFKQ